MSLPLVYKTEARSDIADAYDYYESKRNGLGDEFLEELTAVKDRVVRQPKANRTLWKSDGGSSTGFLTASSTG